MATPLFRVNVIGEAGAGKSSVVKALAADGFEVVGPGDLIRDYAANKGVELRSRKDNVELHRAMVAEDADAIVRPVLASSARLLAIDGLRVYAHARRIADAVGLHTIALTQGPVLEGDAWDALRYLRVLSSQAERGYRDQPHMASQELFKADEAADHGHTDDLDPDIPRMMAMAYDLGVFIDASQPLPLVIADARAYIASQLQGPSQQR